MDNTESSLLNQLINGRDGSNRKAAALSVESIIPANILERKLIMENTETTQTTFTDDEQGQVSAQAEPKDDEDVSSRLIEKIKQLRPSFQGVLLEELEKYQEKEASEQARPGKDIAKGIDELMKLMEDRHPELAKAKNDQEFQELLFQKNVKDVLKATSHSPVEIRPEILAAALSQASSAKLAVDKMAEVEQEVRRVCDCLLDSKAKAVIATLDEVSSVSGISNVGLDYAMDFLHGEYGREQVEQASKEFPDDNNVAFISHIFGLAHSVLE